MTDPLRFHVEHSDATSGARVGRLATPHGTVATPAFMAVGTRGTVRGLTPRQLRGAGCEILLGNAYHLMLRPGAQVVADLGGLHRVMGWDGPLLTDSGGYQAFSIAGEAGVDDDGATIRSEVNGDEVHLTPARSIEIQNLLGADIIMAFDDCPPAATPGTDPAAHRRRLQQANDRTARWLEACVAAHRRPGEQALFGIVQGGTDPQLRAASIAQVCAHDLPGYAIGGVSVGESPAAMRAVVEAVAPRLPEEKPRYLMGVGYERDIFEAVRAGVDLFDCVLPTRNGRTATAFTRHGRINLRNARARRDPTVLEPDCPCEACAGGFGRGTLHHLFAAGEMLGPILVSLHNLAHYQALMLDIRRAIREDGWSSLEDAWPILAATPVPTAPCPP